MDDLSSAGSVAVNTEKTVFWGAWTSNRAFFFELRENQQSHKKRRWKEKEA
jgi:hypothetical protein